MSGVTGWGRPQSKRDPPGRVFCADPLDGPPSPNPLRVGEDKEAGTPAALEGVDRDRQNDRRDRWSLGRHGRGRGESVPLPAEEVDMPEWP